MAAGIRTCVSRGGCAIALWLAVALARGEDWSREAFGHTSFDLGTVARGAKVEHRFPLQDIWEEDVHIASATASCGCTTPTITRPLLKKWERGEIVASVDTREYLGQKDVTIKVVFDKPFPAETQLTLHCYIRSDVVVQPGVVQFGPVTLAGDMLQKVAINYAGRSDWKILRVESPNPNLSPKVVETGRVGGSVNYELQVTLKAGTPPGYIREQLMLVTNDSNPRASRVPVPVEGLVQAALTVHPSPLYMGTVEAGLSINRPLVIRGETPFRIVRVQSSDARFQCVAPTTASSLQRLDVLFTGAARPGRVKGNIHIETDSAAGALDAAVYVDVTAVNQAEHAVHQQEAAAKRSAPTPSGIEL
ncbi:MAG: DUF1573 domain-containing protein [Thermoguttaceae bacterium]